MPDLDLDALSGILVGGSPFDASTPTERKSAVQRRVEKEMATLLDDVVERDFPFLGACYGVGTLGVHQGGVIDREHAEPISAVRITLTPEGRADPLLADVPSQFDAFVGHKEACRVLPPTATLLASSPTCPVQMFRVRENLYATQFHPELDVEGISTRIRVYRDYGYFPPAEADAVLAAVRAADVWAPSRVLAAFVRRYARD
jgi:GMP synthase (glutamine-hydrolysing)